MGPHDLPPQFETGRPAEIRIERRAKINRDFILIAKSEATPVSNPTKKPQFNDLGKIKSMSLPDGWVAGAPEPNRGVPGRVYRYFHAPQSKDVQICYFNRGPAMYKQFADGFRDILSKPAHKLSPEEIPYLRELLREMANPKHFQLNNASTIDHNGKRVLLLEGRYIGIQHDVRELFIDSDGTGQFVQEIYYKAPAAVFQANLPAAIKAFQSIVWK